MVVLNKITTKTGDDGTSGLATGERRRKNDPRFEAIGSIDETNAVIGVARLHAGPGLDPLLAAIQNDLFDLGADLSTPDTAKVKALRISEAQVARLEQETTALNASLSPLTSFILPGGSQGAALSPSSPNGRAPGRTHDGGARQRGEFEPAGAPIHQSPVGLPLCCGAHRQRRRPRG